MSHLKQQVMKYLKAETTIFFSGMIETDDEVSLVSSTLSHFLLLFVFYHSTIWYDMTSC